MAKSHGQRQAHRLKTRGEVLNDQAQDEHVNVSEAVAAYILHVLLLPWRILKRMNKIWEIHTGLGMMEPWEAVVFDLFVFTTLTAFGLAIYTYLPDHLRYMLKRAMYYASGTMVGEN